MMYPLSELIDRYSILLLKKERLPGNKAVDSECDYFYNAICEFDRYPQHQLDLWVGGMKAINAQIWDLESDIRRGNEAILGLEEVGRRALKIREINKKRIAYKNEIAREVGEFEEIKIDHGSA